MPTPAEESLWRHLKGSRQGHKFTRQCRIEDYFVDFCCRQRRVVVELDGDAHLRRIEEDEARDRFLVEQGYVVLRFTNDRWFSEPEVVLSEIRAGCDDRPQFKY